MFKVLACLLFVSHSVCCYKALFILPTPAKSHYQFGSEIARGLAAKGIEVTVVSPFKQPKPMPNYNELYLDNILDNIKIGINSITETNYSTISFGESLNIENAFRNLFCTLTRNNSIFQHFLKIKQKFDVVLVETLACEEFIGLGYYFNAPVISISPVHESTEMHSFSALPALNSHRPIEFCGYTDIMNFGQRMYNMLTYWNLLRKTTHTWQTIQQRYELLIPNTKNRPSLEELKRNISLVILNSHPATTPSSPLMPHMIQVGGLSIKPYEVDALPNDLQTFLNGAQSGAVYFSLGSLVNMSQLSLDTVILNAFKRLPNVRFLAKGDEALLNLFRNTSNVLVRSWFPQKAILSHPQLKCFITHGGLNSIQESVYYAKPVVVMPYFFDQFMNAQWAVEKGYGIKLLFSEMTSHGLKMAIESILYNQSYKQQAETTSEYFRDNIVSSMETAVFWIEYVAATKGAPHLQSIAAHFPTYLYYNFDIWSLYALFLILILFMLWKIASLIMSFRKLCCKKEPKLK